MLPPKRRTFLKKSAAVAAGTTVLAGCLAEDNGDDVEADPDFPTEDITLTIPFGEGGGTDVFLREVANVASDNLDVSIQFENEEGEGGLVGTNSVYNSVPDGYTLVGFNPPSTPTSWLVQEPDFDIGELEGVSIFGYFGYMIYTNHEHEVEDFDDLVDRFEDGEFSQIAGQGEGTMVDVVARVLRDEVGLPWEDYIAYDGGGDVTEAVMSDEVSVGIGTDTGAESGVEEGLLDPVVGLVSEGSGVFPDMDTLEDQGHMEAGDPVDELSQLQVSVWAPPETPSEHRDTIAEAFEEATQSDAVQEFAESSGNVIEYGGPDEADELMESVLETVPDVVDLEEIQEDA